MRQKGQEKTSLPPEYSGDVPGIGRAYVSGGSTAGASWMCPFFGGRLARLRERRALSIRRGRHRRGPAAAAYERSGMVPAAGANRSSNLGKESASLEGPMRGRRTGRHADG